jgi:integrase
MKSQKRQKIAIFAKLYNWDKDLNKQWYVYYSYRNHKTNKMERFKEYEGLNEFKTVIQRSNHAKYLILKINTRIKSGWNPFEDEKRVLYNDTLEYNNVAIKYGNLKKTIYNWNYYLSEWLEKKKQIVRHSTYQTYQSKFRVFCAWLKNNKLDDIDMRCFTKENASAFFKYLAEGRHLSNKMKNQYLILFNDVSRCFIDQEKLIFNSFEKLEKYKRETKVPVPFNDEILIRLKDYLVKNDSQLWIISQFIFYCFLRPAELKLLQIKHIDFINKTVTVPADVSKNHKALPVIIPDHFFNQLIRMNYHNENPEYFVFTINTTPGERPCGENYMSERFRQIRKKLNIPQEFKFYSFKHTGGLKLWKSGADLIEMKNQFRHHSLDQMMDYLKSLEGVNSEHIRTKGFIL